MFDSSQRRRTPYSGHISACLVAGLLFFCVKSMPLRAQDSQLSGLRGVEFTEPVRRGGDTPSNVLSPTEWRRVGDAVDRAVVFLASQQQPDGSFPTLPHGQPG